MQLAVVVLAASFANTVAFPAPQGNLGGVSLGDFRRPLGDLLPDTIGPSREDRILCL